MEAQLQRPAHGFHHYEDDPRDTAVVGSEGGEEHNQHGEKKSVRKKVKDKAKKIKDTITNHGQGHEHDQGRHDQISEEEDEDEEDEGMVVNVPDVHSAPKYDQSPVIPGTNLPIQTSVNLEKPTDTGEDPYNHSLRKEAYPNVGCEGVYTPSPSASASGQGNKARPQALGREQEIENPLRPSLKVVDVGEKRNAGVEPTVKIGPLAGLEEDSHSPRGRPHEIPPSNYQSKVTDPTGEGGKEAVVDPLIRRLDNIHVSEQPSYTGSHDQFSPQPTPTKEEFSPEPNPGAASANPELPKSYFTTPRTESMPRDTITRKISSATSAVANKAISAKNVVASRLGYGGTPQHQEGHQDSSKKPASELVAEYGHRVAETLAPVYGKVVGAAGGTVMSKVQGSGGGAEEKTKGVDKGVSVTEYLAEKFKPGEDDKALSEAIANAFHKKKERLGQPPVAARQVMEMEEEAVPAVSSDSPGAAVSSWLGTSGSAPGGEVGRGEEDVSRQQPS